VKRAIKSARTIPGARRQAADVRTARTPTRIDLAPLEDGLPEVARVDGRRVCIEGADEIVLRCGKASITLRRNGKVVIEGTYVESRSSGIQRIKGAAVKIN
jgi:hypothetical protein